MSSAICFNLDQSKILPSGNGLTNQRKYLFENISERIDDNHCDRIPSSVTADHCFDNDYVR